MDVPTWLKNLGLGQYEAVFRLALTTAAAMAAQLAIGTAFAQPSQAHVALVIGNTAYTLAPSLPACAASANMVAARLRAAGFDVSEHVDASNGVMGAALTDFAQAIALHPGAAAVVYVCGYAVSFADRDFVLPVSAMLTRTSDVLTEGVSAPALSATAGSAQAGPALVLLDLFAIPTPGTAAPTGTLAQESTSGRLAIAVALEPPGPVAATPAATALARVLGESGVKLSGLVADLRSLMPSGGTTLIGQEATADLFLVGEPPKSPPPPPPPPAPAPPATAAAQPPASAGSLPAADVPPAPTHRPLPDEAKMTQGDRREMQIALARLGYYDGRIDGVIGPDSRAAIRRWQHEIGAEMTGTLTGAQATRLVQQQ